jgi:hypothetical protein
LITLAGFVLASTVSAAEYSVDNDISLTSRFDDNARLSVGFKDELYGAALTTQSNFARTTEVSNLGIGLDLRANEYNIDAYSTFDQLLDIGYSRNTERGSWNVNASVDNGSSRDSEATSSGSGRFDLRDTRVTTSALSFSWSNNLNVKNLLVWNGSATSVHYDNARRNDYKYGSTSLLWQYILTDRLRIQATSAYSVLDTQAFTGLLISPLLNDAIGQGVSPDLVSGTAEQCSAGGFFTFDGLIFSRCLELGMSDNEQATTRLQVGIYYLISERLTLDLLVGQSSVDTDSEIVYANLPVQGTTSGVRTGQESSSNDGLTYTGTLRHVAENIETNLRISSSNTVNSNGVLVLTTSADLETRWDIDSRQSISNRFAWFDQETSSQDVTFFNDRVLSQWRFRYRYFFTSEWSGSLSYSIDEQRRDALDREAYRNSFTLTLAWRPTKLKWSR